MTRLGCCVAVVDAADVQMRLQQVPLALASYLQGLRFAPDDPRLKRNAALARRILATARQQAAP